ncbi:titin-like [Phalaenopsis equestris]|uniref:titin-like n=1 Tax=Phalaenopsis equestris TaxID=78828 RepID=UPI0009E22D17|nr:titin-like [Phalaenopsis equestris]
MELEVGVRLTREQGDLTFASTETEAVFILAAHLPGFSKDEIDVAANEEEKQISIRGGGRIACQQAVITRRVAITREVSIESFDESFPVPESVDWDGIDASFDEEEKILFISIPKLLMNECSWIREEETAEHLIQEEQRVETQVPTHEEKNGKSKLMRPYKGKEKLKEMARDSMQPSPAEQLQPGAAGVEGPYQVLETELIESRKEYEDIKIEENREIKREKPKVKTADEVLEAEQIESEDGRMELRPKESYEEGPDRRKSEIEIEGTKDAAPQLTDSEIERRASIEIKEEPIEPHQKDGKSQLEITDQVMKAKRPTKSQEKEEAMQKQEQEHRELEQLLHGFKDDEDRRLKGPDEEPFRARESLKSKELSLDLYKQITEELTLKAPKEMQEAAEPRKAEKEAKVKPQLQQSQEKEVNERKTPIEVQSYEKMRTRKVQVPKEPDKDFKQYEHEVQEDEKPIEVPACEMPKAVELPHKEEPKTKAHKLHEDEDHQWMGHVKEVSKTRMPLDLEEKYKSFQKEEEYMKEKAKKPTGIAHKLSEVAESRKFEAPKKDVEQPEEQELENKTIIQPPREKVSAKKSSEPNEKVGVKEPDQTLDAGLIQSEDIKEDLQQHDDGVKKQDEFIVVPTYEKPDAAGLKQHKQEVQVHENPIIAPTCEKPPVTTPDQGLEDEEHSQPEQLVKEFQRSKEELQEKEKLAIVPACVKSKAAEYSRKEEFQEDKNHQRKGPDVKTSATKKLLILEEESQLLQKEQEIMKKEAQKPTMRESKRLVEAIEPKQSEEKEVEEELDQPEEVEVQKGKMEIVTTHEEVEQEFQITRKSHDEIIPESPEPGKQEEPLPKESTTLQKELTPMLEQIKSKEHHNPTVETLHQTSDMIEFKALEEPALSTAKAPKTNGISKGQEGYQKKESVKSEKPIAGLPFKAPKIKEFRSLEEQEQEFQSQKREYKSKNSDPHQSKERQRETQNVMPTYNQEIEKEIQELGDEESFKRDIILKSPEKFLEQIKPEKEVQKHKLVIKIKESIIPKQKLLQPEEDEMQTAQDFSIFKKPETKAMKEKQRSEQNQESKHQKPAEDSSYLASKTTKLMGLEKLESQDKVSPVHRKLEPGKTKEKEEQRAQLSKKPTNQEATPLLVSEEDKDEIAIAKMLEIEWMPELQEPYKKPEKSLSVESKMQPKPAQKVEAEERVCPSLGAELPDKQAIETSKPESQTKEANKVTESSIPHVESKEHQKPTVEAPYQTLDRTEFKAPQEQERTTPKKPDTKETPERQQRYQQKESKEFEKLVANKIKESRSLKEKEHELQAKQKEEDKTKSHEPHQSKERTERLKELQSVMPTYNDEKEMEIPQLADEEIQQLKSPEQFPKVIKPENAAQTPQAVKEIEESVMPKQKRIQLEEKEAPTPQAVFKTRHPEPSHESKQQKPAEQPPYKVSEEQELQEEEVSVHKRAKPWKTIEKEGQQRGQLNRKPIKQEETILLDSEAEIEKIPNAKTLEIKGVLESQEPYKMTKETLHVEAELQLKLPNEIEAQETLRPAVGAQLPDKLAVRPSERESQNVPQATDSSMPLLQPLESKQKKQLEGPRIRHFMEEVSKQKPEQLNQPDEEEAHKRESPMQELARNGAILEPPDSAERTTALMEQELYRYEEGELARDIESPTLLKPRPFPSTHDDRKVLEHDDTAAEQPKPLPIIRVMMKTDRSPHQLTMKKKATEPTTSPPRIRGAVEPEGSPLQPSPYDEAIKREFPALIQKELHTYSDIQKPEKEETVSRQMPEFEEAESEQGGKTKEQPALHIAKIEIERPTQEVPQKIFESPQQEENPPSPFDHEIKALEVSGDDSEASGAEMDKTTKVKELSKQRHIHCRCHGRRPAFPIPPSTLLSGSAFVFSIMVLVFHFIKRKKIQLELLNRASKPGEPVQ